MTGSELVNRQIGLGGQPVSGVITHQPRMSDDAPVSSSLFPHSPKKITPTSTASTSTAKVSTTDSTMTTPIVATSVAPPATVGPYASASILPVASTTAQEVPCPMKAAGTDDPSEVEQLRKKGKQLQEALEKEREHAQKTKTLNAVSYTHLTLPTICSV